jgi:uncharacterized protein (DUF1330 family)
MPGYLLANVKNIHDPERYKEYSAQTPALTASHGGRYLVRGGEVDPVEMSGPVGRVVVIEFPTFDAAKAYYHGDEYRRLSAIRQSAADSDMLLVDGYDG